MDLSGYVARDTATTEVEIHRNVSTFTVWQSFRNVLFFAFFEKIRSKLDIFFIKLKLKIMAFSNPSTFSIEKRRFGLPTFQFAEIFVHQLLRLMIRRTDDSSFRLLTSPAGLPNIRLTGDRRKSVKNQINFTTNFGQL